MHLTANSHIMYLDNENKFQWKHGIQNHAIILHRPETNSFPKTWFGISSRLWRFHSDEQIVMN